VTRRPLATTKQIAEHYGVAESTVRYWHHRGVGVGPLMFRVGKHLRARWDDIDNHDAQQLAAQQREAA